MAAKAMAAKAKNIGTKKSNKFPIVAPGQTGPFITPAEFGAVGNDVTDDTTALQNLGAAVQAAGSGRILFPANKIYKVYSGAQALNPLFNFIGIRGVDIDFNGSQIKIYKNFVGTGSILFMIIFDSTKFITLRNLDVKQVTPVTVPGTVEGVTSVIFQRASEHIRMDNIKLDGGVLPVQFQRNTATESLAQISGKAFLSNIQSINSIYGFSCADSGNDIVIRNLVTSNVMRSYFIYGCNNHDIELTSTNAQSNDCLIVGAVVSTGTPTLHVENVKLRYRVKGRTAGAAASYLTLGMAQNISNCVLRNIDAEIDFDYRGEPGTGRLLPPAVQFIKKAASQNLVFDNIKIHGGIRNVPNSADDLFKIFDDTHILRRENKFRRLTVVIRVKAHDVDLSRSGR